jgi:4-hydroxy-tetrahydrodipicolinate synthase
MPASELAAKPAVADLTGYASAVPTPFRGGLIDEFAFAEFCAWQIAQGIAALIICGTTGEAPTLAPAEQRRLIRLAVETAAGRVPVIAGIGSPSTAQAVELARAAERAEADGLLAVVPYYNRPSQDGLVSHFRAVHDTVRLPVLLYDVPSRCSTGLQIETILRLAELPRIVGLKDASADLARPAVLRRHLGRDFRLLSGDDATALGFFAQGGDGCISVASNVAPRLCQQMHAAWVRGDRAEAEMLTALLGRLTAALFLESNPVPVKYALHRLGRMSDEVRLPLCRAVEPTRNAVSGALARLGLINGPIVPPCAKPPRSAAA